MPGSPAALRTFKTAAWKTEEQLVAFVAEIQWLDPESILRWLGVLLDADARTDLAGHRKRLRAFATLAAAQTDPELFVPYVKALRAADPELRRLLVALLPRVNSVQSHGMLCAELGSRDPEVRQAACQVLAQVGGRAAFEALYGLVANASFMGRIESLEVMLPKAPQQAFPLVARVLAHGHTHERVHALRLVAGLALPPQEAAGATQIAASVLEDPEPSVVEAALTTIARHSSPDTYFDYVERLLAEPRLSHATAAIRSVAANDSPRALALLQELIERAPTALRTAALEAVESRSQDALEPILIAAAAQDRVAVRTKALEAIARLATAGRVDPAKIVLPLLGSRDLSVRRMAIEVLHRVGDPRGEMGPRLLKLLRDEDWWVRERAMDALIDLAGKNLSRYLVPYLTDRSAIVRRFAIGALRRLRDPAALSHLLQRAKVDDDWWAAEDALVAAAELRDPRAIPAIVALLRDRHDLRCVCCRALVDLRATSALDAIVELLTDQSAEVRMAALTALRDLDARQHLRAVEPCADDGDTRVAAAAREIVSRWEAVDEPSTLRRFVGLDDLLPLVVETDADDLLLLAGRPPYLKRRGQVEALPTWGEVSDRNLRAMVLPHLSEVQRRLLDDGKDVDLSYDMAAIGARFRINLFHQATGLGAVFRIIKNDALLMVLENLGLPPAVAQLCGLRDGLVLVGGPTGTGKSTTLAAMVARINQRTARHIVTIEDPIEAVHVGDKSLITQREVRSHTPSFDTALRATLRQDPDVIVVGEMRDPPTFQFAVSAAETGHLVLATIHAGSAESCVSRIIGAFPPGQQPLVRAMLAGSLRGIICQALLERRGGAGRLLVAEVMIANEAIASLIRKGKAFQIPSVIVTSASQGMQLLDMELARLVREQIVEFDAAWRRANDKAMFEGLVTGTLQAEALASLAPESRAAAARAAAPPDGPAAAVAGSVPGPGARPSSLPPAPARASAPPPAPARPSSLPPASARASDPPPAPARTTDPPPVPARTTSPPPAPAPPAAPLPPEGTTSRARRASHGPGHPSPARRGRRS